MTISLNLIQYVGNGTIVVPLKQSSQVDVGQSEDGKTQKDIHFTILQRYVLNMDLWIFLNLFHI